VAAGEGKGGVGEAAGRFERWAGWGEFGRSALAG
jgi:hypothetical protein